MGASEEQLEKDFAHSHGDIYFTGSDEVITTVLSMEA